MMSEDKKRLLVDLAMKMGTTLNGQPAYVTGYTLPFAKVYDKSSGLSCEFAWETVERILNTGGKFKS